MAKDSIVDPDARDKYLLQVTAGPTYEPSTHQDVPVNGPDSITIESPLVTCYLKVRIRDYHGLPHGSPSSSPYFQHKLHTSDRYSIAFSFIPKSNLNGSDIVLGFDYDHSIKHQLPPGFKYAMKIATSVLDPGLYADAYCDEPYLYGPALSGLFTLNIGEKVSDVCAAEQLTALENENSGVVEEGGTGSGQAVREDHMLPSKWKKRRKHFLDASALEKFTFEEGRMYHADFFNAHLDFANFSLRLPGFSISVAKYIDEKTHHLRFVLKNRSTGEVLFVVFFKLLFGEELERVENEKRKEYKGESREQRNHTQAPRPKGAPLAEEKDIAPENAAKLGRNRTAQAPATNDESDEEEEQKTGSSATSAVTSLSNSIYAAFVAMGLRDDNSSSSDDEAPSRDASNRPAGQNLNTRVDDMDDATVEKYLQSRQGNNAG